MPTLDGKLRLRSSNPTPKYLPPSCGSAAFASYVQNEPWKIQKRNKIIFFKKIKKKKEETDERRESKEWEKKWNNLLAVGIQCAFSCWGRSAIDRVQIKISLRSGRVIKCQAGQSIKPFHERKDKTGGIMFYALRIERSGRTTQGFPAIALVSCYKVL